MILEINQKLSSDAFDIENPRIINQGKNSDVKDLVNGILDGSIKGILTFGIDPGYTLPMGVDFVKALQKVDLSVVFSMKENETSAGAEYIAAVPHYLESWGDYEFKHGHYSLAQPTIQPATRPAVRQLAQPAAQPATPHSRADALTLELLNTHCNSRATQNCPCNSIRTRAQIVVQCGACNFLHVRHVPP